MHGLLGRFNAHITARQFCGSGRFHVLRICQRMTFANLIKGKSKPDVTCRRDGSVATCEACDLSGEFVGAVVAAKQGNCERTIFGDRDDRRLAVLVVQMGPNGADEYAAGTEANDGASFLEQPGEMAGCLGIGGITACHAIGRVDLTVECRFQLPGQRQGGDPKHEDDRPHHASPPV